MSLADDFDRLRKEALVIRGAPVSFGVVCLVMAGIMWTGFHLVYLDRLDNAHELVDHWKSEADFWKSFSSHPVQSKVDAPSPQSQSNPLNRTPIATEGQKKGVAHGSQHPSDHTSVNAPAGIAIGGNNNGTATVTNIGEFPRSLTNEQQLQLSKALSTPSPNLDNVACQMSDSDGCKLADQIVKILQADKWDIGGVDQAKLEDWKVGIFVTISPADSASPPDGVRQVFEAFRAAGIGIQGMRLTGQTSGKFGILVGGKA